MGVRTIWTKPGSSTEVYPLRRNARLRQASALVAFRQAQRPGAASEGNQAWPELARAVVEADFAATEALSGEQQQSRRLQATLGFLRHLAELDTEVELAAAIVQAAAIWFDVDARIFQRQHDGHFLLHTSLPGAAVADGARRLSSQRIDAASGPLRRGPVPEWQTGEESEVALIPLSSSGSTEWVLALIGALPAEEDALFDVLGRVAGTQFEAIRGRRRESARARFQALVQEGAAVHELVAVRLVRELADSTGAGYAALMLNRPGRERRLVSFGAAGEPPLPASEGNPACQFVEGEFTCTMAVAVDASATLVLRPPVGGAFADDADTVIRAAVEVLQNWLAGAYQALDHDHESRRPEVAEFAHRIDQELERARRFDLRLSLVIVRVPEQAADALDAAAVLHAALRQELRGSDVLGVMNGNGVVALLTHTDHEGSDRVVVRLRRRLNEAAGRLGVAGVTVGRAAFSPECSTTDALLSQAIREAQPVSA